MRDWRVSPARRLGSGVRPVWPKRESSYLDWFHVPNLLVLDNLLVDKKRTAPRGHS